MIHGLDTGFLVAAEVTEHADHSAARQILANLVAAGDRIAITPQVLAEFLLVVTDPRRFTQPLEMSRALRIAELWWTASEVERVFPNDTATRQFLAWLSKHSFGRKRLLDTLHAATFHEAGIRSILTTNASDFAVFGAFECIAPGSDSNDFQGLFIEVAHESIPYRQYRPCHPTPAVSVDSQPQLPMIIVFPRQRIDTKQEAAAHRAIDHMNDRNFIRREHIHTRYFSHVTHHRIHVAYCQTQRKVA